MAKSKTKSFIVTRRLYLCDYEYDYLQKKMDDCNKIYNTAVKHYKKIVNKLYKDDRYIKAIEKFKKSKDKKESKIIANEIFGLMKEYKLNEYDIHAYMGYQKVNAFHKCLGINIIQKLGTNLYASIKKAVFSQTDIHYRKKGQTCSFEDKKAITGIVYNKDNDTVRFMKRTFKLKPIRKNDTYLKECMTHNIKYCRIVRKPFKNKYKYFLQIIMEGEPPKKFKLGQGKCGLDEGISTIATYNNDECSFKVLADGIEKYELMVYKSAQKYTRRLHLNNPDCFNPDGTIIKGSKFKRTKGIKKALMELKNAYRLKSAYINRTHRQIINKLIGQCDTVIKEPMDFKALQRRSKTLQRQEKTSIVKGKKIHKYKRRKRYGKSIGRRAPGLFNQIIEEKVLQYGGIILEVDSKEYKASQYNHITKEAIKPKLSDRTKTINENIVQRDLYSSFLLYCMLNETQINFEECNILFNDFLNKQNIVVNEIKEHGDITNNFGIKYFK